MEKDIFNYIGEWFSHKSVTPSSSARNESEVCDKVLNLLKERSKSMDFRKCRLKLYVNTNDCSIDADMLKAYISQEKGYAFRNIEVLKGVASENDRIEIMQNIAMVLETREKAVIEEIEKGTLIGERIELDSEEINSLPDQRYNIGLGTAPNIGGMPRINQIAVDDNNKSADIYINKNKYVSRTHAHIIYDPDAGFVLYAEKKGTASLGKRTRIIRKTNNGEIVINIDSINDGKPLKDGDVINLTNKVYLRYREN